MGTSESYLRTHQANNSLLQIISMHETFGKVVSREWYALQDERPMFLKLIPTSLMTKHKLFPCII